MSKSDIDPRTNDDPGMAIEAQQEPAKINRRKENLPVAAEIREGAKTTRNVESKQPAIKRLIRHGQPALADATSEAAPAAQQRELSAAGNGGVGKSDVRKTKFPSKTMAETVLGLLRRKKGASIDEMKTATGWQAHSLRGLLSGTVGKRMGLALESAPDRSGVRRYRIVDRPAEREG
jgi:hypothetical protein